MKPVPNILTELAIEHRPGTQGVSSVCCPFCPRLDAKFHCGVFHDRGNFYCFRCGAKGQLYALLKALVPGGMSREDYQAVTEGLLPEPGDTAGDAVRRRLQPAEMPKQPKMEPVPLPLSTPVNSVTLKVFPLLETFLHERRMNVGTCADYLARVTGAGAGEYANRLIVPIWDEKGTRMTFQARDLTGRGKPKWLSGHGVDIRQLLYWTDLSAGIVRYPARVYVVEGVFDAWRMGDNAAATFGTGVSARQRALLVNDPAIEEIVFAWDADAYHMAVGQAEQIAPLKRAGVVRLPDGEDPDSLGSFLVRSLEVRWL